MAVLAGRKISALMFDLSGTVHIGDQLLPGVTEAVSIVRSLGLPLQFVSNTSKETVTSLTERVHRAGLDVEQDSIFTSLSAARDLVRREGLTPLLLLEDSAAQEFSDLDDGAGPDCVLVGLAPSRFHYDKLNEAFKLVKNGGRLIAINKSRYFQDGSELALGTGAFVSGLEFSTDTTAEVVGKPSKAFFQLAAGRFSTDIPLKEILMIGDDVRDDVLGAQTAGLTGGLVKTGKYRQGDENKFSEKPDFVFESLLEMANGLMKI